MDVHTKVTRSRNMAAIRSKDTKPELLIRKELFHRGFRYRINQKTLPGKPDIVLKKYNAVIFVHGCFWHKHDCSLFKWPSTRKEFWKKKITRNYERDEECINKLKKGGWRILIIWECSLKGKNKRPLNAVITSVIIWLNSNKKTKVIQGKR